MENKPETRKNSTLRGKGRIEEISKDNHESFRFLFARKKMKVLASLSLVSQRFYRISDIADFLTDTAENRIRVIRKMKNDFSNFPKYNVKVGVAHAAIFARTVRF